MNDDEPDTPGPRRQRLSEEAHTVANLGLALESIAVCFREAARQVDQLEGDERRLAYLKLAEEIADHGDDCHVVRRLIEDIYR